MKQNLLTILVALCIIVPSSFADDLYAPSWRGQEGTTMALWDFGTPDVTPNIEVNEYGSTVLTPYPGWNQEWEDQWGGRQGVWPLSGAIDIAIPNRPEQLPMKIIWIQLSWAEQFPGSRPTVTERLVSDPPLEAELIREISMEPSGYLGPWTHSTYKIVLEPNPDFELIRIEGGIMVDQLVIDTWCTVPEPGVMLFVGAGLLTLIKKRK